MSSSRVFYAEHDNIHGLKFIGDIRYTIGAALDKFIKTLCDGPKPRGFMVDLRGTESIDSTSLGLLAYLANCMQRCGAPKVTLVSTNEDINDLLFAIGFDQVFDIVDETGHTLQEGQELGLDVSSGPEMALTVLEAHRTLMAMGEDNKARFKDVVELFEQQLASPRHAVG